MALFNESFADVFGSLVKQHSKRQRVEEADWLIGRELFLHSIKGKVLRSLKNPGTAYEDPVLGGGPQPAHMKNYVLTDEDNGGVHINSGIPNEAFYETAMRLGGYGVGKSGIDLVSYFKKRTFSGSCFSRRSPSHF